MGLWDKGEIGRYFGLEKGKEDDEDVAKNRDDQREKDALLLRGIRRSKHKYKGLSEER